MFLDDRTLARPMQKSLENDLAEGQQGVNKMLKKQMLQNLNLSKYEIKGGDDAEWEQALKEKGPKGKCWICG